jgi:hypothetical protein
MTGAGRPPGDDPDRDSSAPEPAAWILPPAPGLGGWLSAGACTGLLVGAAELLLADLAAVPVPARVGALLALGAALVGTCLAATAALALRALRVRASHSGLVGACIGLLLALSIPGDLAGAGLGLAALPSALAGGIVAVVAGWVGARLGDRLERAGMPLRPLAVLAPAAMLYALAEAIAAAPSGLRGLGGAALLALGLASLAAGIAARAARRTAAASPWSRQLAASVAVAAAVLVLPRALPWLLADPEPATIDGSSPVSVLVVDLGNLPDPLALPALALFASDAVRFELIADRASIPAALLSDVAPFLGARGWRSAAVVTDAEDAVAAGIDDVDARPGPAGALALVAERTVAGPLAVAAAPLLPAALGLARAQRSAAERAAAARAWLIDWRARRAHAPFLLFVELAGDPAPSAGASGAHAGLLDSALDHLLSTLRRLDAETATLVLVVARRGDGGIDALARLPGGAHDAPRGVRAGTPVPASALAAALRELPGATAGSPPTLPGVGRAAPPAASRHHPDRRAA